jgi:hypothetical protein
LKLLFTLLVSLLMTGCASITMSEFHGMRVDTKTADGAVVTGANCKLTNDFAPVELKSGSSANVRRSNKDMDIVCSTANQSDARGTAISRANAGLAGNILFGGGIGAIIDHNTGKAYTYPNWVQLIFGQTRIFDRRVDKEGEVNMGALPGQTPAANGVAPKAASLAPAAAASLAPVTPVAAPAPVVVTAPRLAAAPLVAAVPASQATVMAPVGALSAPVAVAAPARRDINDVAALPFVGNNAKKGYAEWLTKPGPKAFAISERGNWAGTWGTDVEDAQQPTDPTERALWVCSRRATVKCKLYAVDGAVVWGDAAPAVTK